MIADIIFTKVAVTPFAKGAASRNVNILARFAAVIIAKYTAPSRSKVFIKVLWPVRLIEIDFRKVRKKQMASNMSCPLQAIAKWTPWTLPKGSLHPGAAWASSLRAMGALDTIPQHATVMSLHAITMNNQMTHFLRSYMAYTRMIKRTPTIN